MVSKKKQRLCKLCHAHPAEVPDRYSGRPRNEICRGCHTKRLAGDFIQAVTPTRERLDQES